jgi:hemolysin activation/secretion protein
MTQTRPSLLFILLLSSAAVAQTPPGAADVLRANQPPPSSPVEETPVLPAPAAETRPAINLAGDFKVIVKAFKITGNTAITSDVLQAALVGYLDREVDAAGLSEAANKVRRVYTRQGYFLATAYLPRQEIRDGVVEIAVLEGRLGEIKINVDRASRFNSKLARRVIEAHIKPGDLITETALERPLLIIRDMAGPDAKSYLEPGKEPGTADLRVDVIPDRAAGRVGATVELDNYGNRFAGEYRLTGTAHYNSPLWRGDRLSAGVQIANQSGSYLGNANWVIPVGPYGTKFAAAYAELQYKLGNNEQFTALDAHGRASIASLSVLHPVIRRRGANLLVRLGYDYKDTRDSLNNLAADDRKKVTSAVVEASADYFDSRHGYTYGSLAFSSGKTDFRNSDLAASDAVSGKTEGSFNKTNWSIARLQQLRWTFYLNLAASGQIASKNLTPVEKFFLGGPNAVRAYPAGDAVGDNGQLYSIELRHTVPGAARYFGERELTASLFYDWGRVQQFAHPGDISGGVQDNDLKRHGWGLGLSVGTRETWLMKLSLAVSTSGDPATGQSDTAHRNPRAYFQAVKSF